MQLEKLHSGKNLTVFILTVFRETEIDREIEIISFSSFDTFIYTKKTIYCLMIISLATKDHNALFVNSVNFIKMNNNIFQAFLDRRRTMVVFRVK